MRHNTFVCKVHTRFAELTASPWANGAGTTTELVTLEDSVAVASGLPRWKLSIARLTQPAAFSHLPGLTRSFMPVGGSVALLIDGVRHLVEAATVLRFRGDQTVELTECAAPCHAVNLMSEGSLPTLVPEGSLARICDGTGCTIAAVALGEVALAGEARAASFDLLVPYSGVPR